MSAIHTEFMINYSSSIRTICLIPIKFNQFSIRNLFTEDVFSDTLSCLMWTPKQVKAIPVLSHYRPRCSHVSRQSACEGDNFDSRRHRPPPSPTKYSWYFFLLEAEVDTEAIVQPEGLHKMPSK
jgi:hypothetical protein